MKHRYLPIGRIWTYFTKVHNDLRLVHLLLLSTTS